jgi:hypothetical protein
MWAYATVVAPGHSRRCQSFGLNILSNLSKSFKPRFSSLFSARKVELIPRDGRAL